MIAKHSKDSREVLLHFVFTHRDSGGSGAPSMSAYVGPKWQQFK
jgi:hypothetical protein